MTHKAKQTIDDFPFVEISHSRVSYLREPGGGRSMAVNGSVTPVLFSYMPPTGFDFLGVRLSGHLIDNQALNADDFGGINGPLTNGVRMYATGPDGVETHDLLDNTTLQRNGDFDTFFTTTALLSSRGLGFNWAFPLLPIRIRNLSSLVVSIEDNLTTLVHFEMALHGILVGAYID